MLSSSRCVRAPRTDPSRAGENFLVPAGEALGHHHAGGTPCDQEVCPDGHHGFSGPEARLSLSRSRRRSPLSAECPAADKRGAMAGVAPVHLARLFYRERAGCNHCGRGPSPPPRFSLRLLGGQDGRGPSASTNRIAPSITAPPPARQLTASPPARGHVGAAGLLA